MTPRIVELKSKKFVGLSEEMSLVDNKTFEVWKNFRQHSKKVPNKLSQDFISLQDYPEDYFETFSPAKNFVKWACVEVDSFKEIPSGLGSLFLEGGLGKWIPNSNYILDHRPHFEVLGAKYKNNDSTSEEEIWIPIKTK